MNAPPNDRDPRGGRHPGRVRRLPLPASSALFAVLLSLSCTQITVVDVGEIVVVPEAFAVSVSEQTTLKAEVRDLDGNPLSDRDVVWRSLNDAIAVVGEDGIVTGVKAGVAVVTASVDGVVGVSQATVRNRRDGEGGNEPDPPGGGGDPEPTGSRPQGPGNLEAERKGAKRVDVKWRDRADNEDRFDVQRRVEGGNWSLLTRPKANAESLRDEDVESESAYEYRIHACNEHGCSDWVGPVSVGAHDDGGGDGGSSGSQPGKPSNLEAERKGAKRVDLKWRDRADNEDRFELQRRPKGGSWSLLSRLDANDEEHRDRDDVEGQSGYQYRIRACNGDGCSGWAGPASVGKHQAGGDDDDDDDGDDDDDDEDDDDDDGGSQTAAAPSAPTGLKAKAKPSENRIDLEWRDRSNDETGFELQRQPAGQSWGTLATLGRNVKEYRDEGVAGDSEYRYRVRACNDHGCSGFSNVASSETG